MHELFQMSTASFREQQNAEWISETYQIIEFLTSFNEWKVFSHPSNISRGQCRSK